jgi:hypothetical protein
LSYRGDGGNYNRFKGPSVLKGGYKCLYLAVEQQLFIPRKTIASPCSAAFWPAPSFLQPNSSAHVRQTTDFPPFTPFFFARVPIKEVGILVV